jgi:hypothetical protein
LEFYRKYLKNCTPCCGLVVQNPTHALKTVEDQYNTFEFKNPLWIRTLSLEFEYGVFIEPPPPI